MKDEMKQALLADLKSEFDDYLPYYDLMGCLPGITEARIKTLKDCRTRNGLDQISYFTQLPHGTLMVSAAGFREWVKRNFKKPLLI